MLAARGGPYMTCIAQSYRVEHGGGLAAGFDGCSRIQRFISRAAGFNFELAMFDRSAQISNFTLGSSTSTRPHVYGGV